MLSRVEVGCLRDQAFDLEQLLVVAEVLRAGEVLLENGLNGDGAGLLPNYPPAHVDALLGEGVFVQEVDELLVFEDLRGRQQLLIRAHLALNRVERHADLPDELREVAFVVRGVFIAILAADFVEEHLEDLIEVADEGRLKPSDRITHADRRLEQSLALIVEPDLVLLGLGHAAGSQSFQTNLDQVLRQMNLPRHGQGLEEQQQLLDLLEGGLALSGLPLPSALDDEVDLVDKVGGHLFDGLVERLYAARLETDAKVGGQEEDYEDG